MSVADAAVSYALLALFVFWRMLTYQGRRPWRSLEIQGAALCGLLWPLFVSVCAVLVMAGVMKRRAR